MFRRRRPVLRAAAIGGGAYIAGKRATQLEAEQAQLEDEQNERLATLEQQRQVQGRGHGQPGGNAAVRDVAAPSVLDHLKQLAALHRQGALTDSEFSEAKAKLLAG